MAQRQNSPQVFLLSQKLNMGQGEVGGLRVLSVLLHYVVSSEPGARCVTPDTDYPQSTTCSTDASLHNSS